MSISCWPTLTFMCILAPEQICRRIGTLCKRNIWEGSRCVSFHYILRKIIILFRNLSQLETIQDEIDALATSRASDTERTSSHEGVLTSLLNEMDGVQELNGVTVIAATNRPEVLVGPYCNVGI